MLAQYDRCYPAVERAMWADDSDFYAILADYQALFREQEALIRRQGMDNRHHFILGIPAADRPAHLAACLESIAQVCELYGYGGQSEGVWDKCEIVIAEDSREARNIQRHQELAAQYRLRGLRVHYFGLDEQYELLQTLPQPLRARLGRLLTEQPKARFYLKGQAANRNLCYLKFRQLTHNREQTLYYLIDSDQNLCVNRRTARGEETVYALNYFYIIDRIFRDTDTALLTGKIVGDPPVSPSVMAVNFLDDISAFFERLAVLPGAGDCQFHQLPGSPPHDAAYHDMARLFGFEQRTETYPYPCRLAGAHDHAACLEDFAGRLGAFFFGEHLTRKTWFSYGDGFTRLSPARTVYPGNYIARFDGLKYIIPFGHLRLRMSGPTAGRLIAAEIGARFAAFNMPNLHRRTTAAGLAEDFRPGVAYAGADERIDLSDEFERQFFGDLMLFTTTALTRVADVSRPFPRAAIETLLDQTETELLTLYQQKHAAISELVKHLRALAFDPGRWWLDASQQSLEMAQALEQVRTFLANIELNFGARASAWRQIQSSAHRLRRKEQIVEALMNYRDDRDAWDSLFAD